MFNAKGLILIVSVFFISACSTQFFYNRIPFVVSYYLAGYVDLNKNQETVLEQELSNWFVDHKSVQLPQYVEFLEDIKSEVEKGNLTVPQLKRWDRRIEQYFDDYFNAWVPVMTDWVFSLSPKQIAQAKKKIIEDAQEQREDYFKRSLTERVKYNNKRLLKRINQVSGDLSDEQQRWVTEFIESVATNDTAWFDASDQWRQALFLAYDRGDKKAFGNLLINRQAFWSPKLRMRYNENKAKMMVLMMRLSASSTAQQRQVMGKQIGLWIKRLSNWSKS